MVFRVVALDRVRGLARMTEHELATSTGDDRPRLVLREARPILERVATLARGPGEPAPMKILQPGLLRLDGRARADRRPGRRAADRASFGRGRSPAQDTSGAAQRLRREGYAPSDGSRAAKDGERHVERGRCKPDAGRGVRVREQQWASSPRDSTIGRTVCRKACPAQPAGIFRTWPALTELPRRRLAFRSFGSETRYWSAMSESV